MVTVVFTVTAGSCFCPGTGSYKQGKVLFTVVESRLSMPFLHALVVLRMQEQRAYCAQGHPSSDKQLREKASL